MNRPATFGHATPSLSPAAPPVVRIDAAASWHPDGISVGRVSLLVDNLSPSRLTVLAHGTPEEVDHHPAAAHAFRVDLSDHILLPGLVNAHTHLDLTHLGPHPWDAAQPFSDWVAVIRAGRLADPGAIARAVHAGAALARAGGTAIVGDIAGAVRAGPSLAAALALAATGLRGVSFVEFFAIGIRAADNVARLSETLDAANTTLARGLRLGLQPHATNTVDPEAYLASIDFAVQWGLPLATHLAESPEEREFIARASGPQRALLEQVGVWDDTLLGTFGQGRHPVAHLESVLREARAAYRPFVVAHVNDATDASLEILAATRTSVAYCPRASAYFGADRHFGPHRYRDMLAAGINVCLGTDSVVNITDGTVPGLENALSGQIAGIAGNPHHRLSVLDEMRLLARRDGTDPLTLIRMGTTHGTRALGMGSEHVRLTPQQTPLAILGVAIDESLSGPAAVRRALELHTPPISILTRILPVSQQ